MAKSSGREGCDEFINNLARHGSERAEGVAAQDGGCGGIEDLEALECIGDAAAGYEGAIVFDEGDGLGGGEGDGDLPAAAVEMAEGDFPNFLEEKVALRDGAGIEVKIADGEGGGVNGEGMEDGADFGVLAVDGAVNADGGGGPAIHAADAFADEEEVAGCEGGGVCGGGGDEEFIGAGAYGEAALAAIDEAAPGGGLDGVAEQGSQLAFAGGGGEDLLGEDGAWCAGEFELGVGEAMDFAEQAGLEDGFGGEIEHLETAECGGEVFAGDDDAVILEEDAEAIGVAFEDLRDVAAEEFAARQSVTREAGGAADLPCLRQDAGCGDLAANAEADEGFRVGVDDGAQIGAGIKDAEVKGMIWGGDLVGVVGAVRGEMDDVGGAEVAFIEAGGGNPGAAGGIAHGDAATESSSHAAAVDTLEGGGDFMARMEEAIGHDRNCKLEMARATGLVLPFPAPCLTFEGLGEEGWAVAVGMSGMQGQ